jgi:hypothetical protein
MPSTSAPCLKALPAGQALPRHHAATDGSCQAWTLVSGLLCLGPGHPVQAAATVYAVARPGDLVGLPAAPADACAWALVPCMLQTWSAPVDAAGWPGVLQRLCTQQWRQAADLAQVRQGAVADRVRHLLLLLARAGPGTAPLPSLRAMSQLVDAAPETVSRVLSALRELELLQTAPGARRHSACRATPQLASCALPSGLTGSDAIPRRARLQALRAVAPPNPRLA